MLQEARLPTLLCLSWLILCADIATAAPPVPQPAAKPLDPTAIYVGRVVPFLKKHCLECHGPDVQEAEIGFHDYKTVEKVAGDLQTWTRVLQMIETGVMPPDDSPQPTAVERKQVIGDLEKILFHVDCDGPHDPGRVTIRRLNRAEYNNTVRDLLGVEFQPADDFPSDDVGSGFDNIGDVLTLPPLLMEKYLSAAERIAEKSIVTDPKLFVTAQRRDRKQLRGSSDKSVTYSEDRRRWSISSNGSVSAEFDFPRAGQYVIRVSASASQAGDEAAQMELRLEGKKLKVFDINSIRSASNYQLQFEAPQGEHRIEAAFINDFYDADAKDREKRDRNLYVYSLELDGPVDFRPDDYPAIHRKLIAATPDATRSVSEAARTNLRPLLNRAFRRKITEDEVGQFVRLVEASVGQKDTFEQGMQVALTAVLVSPSFLFRVENGVRPGNPQAVQELGDYELASRLSYFLWSSMPDDELFAAATSGQLRQPEVLERHIRRMLADPKSDALVQNFATQWLNLRLLDGVTPDPKAFPDFSPELRADMRRETELFAQAIIREDRSVLDFLDGRFTFVNERLARHYGIPKISGSEFQRVSFTDNRRGGVLTQASVLTLTSNPARTSPVKRGKWILENILGTPPPDPPPDVPELEATQRSKPGLPLRKQLEIHRSNAVCASCHKTMDELGFGLENFDAIGRWREQDGKMTVDSSGKLPSGESFRGALEMAQVLKRRKADFGRCLAEKMLTFALGRGLESYDRCAIDTIVERLEKHDYRFSAMVIAIAHSDPFRKTRGEGPKP